MERERQRHVAMTVMMSVGLTIGGDVYQLWPLIGETVQEPFDETVALIEKLLKCDGARNWSVVEEDSDGATGRKIAEIGTSRVDTARRDVLPLRLSDFPDPPGLRGC